jgi:hypothetical protein
MSLNTSIQNKQIENVSTLFATATLIIYDGAVPANANTGLGAQVALATHTLAGFNAAVNGVIAVPDDSIADATIAGSGTNTSTFARLFSGADAIQLSVGLSGANVTVGSTSYTAGGLSSITALTITQPAT